MKVTQWVAKGKMEARKKRRSVQHTMGSNKIVWVCCISFSCVLVAQFDLKNNSIGCCQQRRESNNGQRYQAVAA
jgi:hypothetical protein